MVVRGSVLVFVVGALGRMDLCFCFSFVFKLVWVLGELFS